MATTTYDIIVLGVGVMGASTCLALAKRGLRVLGLEQYSVPNVHGSSHGHTRMTRSAYYEHPDYVPLIQCANNIWRDIEQETRTSLLHLTGAIYIGEPDSELIAGSKRAADLHKLDYRTLDSNSITSEFPQFQIDSQLVGLWERDAGYIFAEQAVCAVTELALRTGAKIHGCEQVLSWESHSTEVTVTTDKGNYSAAQLIICGGPWTEKIIHTLGVKLTVTRQALGWVWPQKPDLFMPGRFIPFAVGDKSGSLHYGFPILPGAVGMKVASHAIGLPTNPDSIDRNASDSDEATFLTFIRSVLPDANGATLAIRVCMYTCSPDSNFIISRLPSHENVTIGCAFSGHGFKFAPVIGEALADLALNRESQLPIQFLSIDRFL